MLTNIRKRVVSFQGLGKGSAQYVADAAFKVRTVHGDLLLILEGMTMAYMPDLNKTILLFHHLKERCWLPNLLAGDMWIGEHSVLLINEGRLDYVDIFPAGDSAEERLLLLENAQNVLSKAVVEPQEASCFLVQQDTAMYYHAMLGHFGKKATISTLKKITDIPIGDVNSMDFNKFSHECADGKMKNARKGCGRIHVVDKPKYPGQIVSMDFQGPFPKTPSGLKYVLTAIDHHSSHCWAVKHKDNAYEEVARVLKDLSTKSGYVGSIMAHMDNEPLWTCDKMADVLKENNAIRR
jgi:hypothetical protein